MDPNVPFPAEYRSRHAAEDIRQWIEKNENEIKRLRRRLQKCADPKGFFWLKDKLQGLKRRAPLYERELLALIPERKRLKKLCTLLGEKVRHERRKDRDRCRQFV